MQPFSLSLEHFRLTHIEAGHYDSFQGGETHTKTIPWMIVAQSTVGCYEVERLGQRGRCEVGGLFLSPANVPITISHHPDFDQGGRMASRWVHLELQMFGVLEASQFFEMPPVLNARVSRDLGNWIQQVLEIGNRIEGIQKTFLLKEGGYSILAALMPHLNPLPRLDAILSHSERLLPLLHFLQQNLAAPLQVSDMARKTHMSSSRFHAFFKETLGQPPMEYLKALRLNRARYLLRGSSRPVHAIASETGFANPFHFSRVFRERFGQPPRQYRQNPKDILTG